MMKRPADQLIEEFFACQRRILRALHGNLSGWADSNLTMAQLKTLVVLVDDGPCPIGRIGEALSVSLPNASHLVDKLVRLGLAERAEDVTDRRRTLASATQQGVEVLRSLREGGHAQMRAALLRVDPSDLNALVQGLDALAEALEREVTPTQDSPTRQTGDA
jgi:DNA-binding MarR family transcriptional regulator